MVFSYIPEPIRRALSKCLLFSFGPFFCYPWKPIVNENAGVSYYIANKHFWQQHKDTYNLLWHCVCLFFQLWSNFALLERLDAPVLAVINIFNRQETNLLIEWRWISFVCLVLWGIALLLPRGKEDCPWLGKIVSLVCLVAAYFTAYKFTGQFIELVCVGGFVCVFVLQLAIRGTKALTLRGTKATSTPLILALLVIKIAAYYSLMNSSYKGALAHMETSVIRAFVGSLIAMGLFLPDPLIFVVAYGSVAGHILSALVDNSTLFLFCSAFTATLFQGIAFVHISDCFLYHIFHFT